jgi:hypothetical protein
MALTFSVPRFGTVRGHRDGLAFTIRPYSRSDADPGCLHLEVVPAAPLEFDIGPRALSLEPGGRRAEDLARVLGRPRAGQYHPATATLVEALLRRAAQLDADRHRISLTSRAEDFRWDEDPTGERTVAWVREVLDTCRGLAVRPQPERPPGQ